METTVTLEFIADSLLPLRTLEHELKAIHGLKVFFVEPKDQTAPVLISLGMNKKDEQADVRIRRITHTLYEFLHSSDAQQIQVTLVTIEGESVNIVALESEEIRQIIARAYAEQSW
jgi:hypothetical protein